MLIVATSKCSPHRPHGLIHFGAAGVSLKVDTEGGNLPVLGGFNGAPGGQVFRHVLGSTTWTDISPPVDVPFGGLALDGAGTPTTIYVVPTSGCCVRPKSCTRSSKPGTADRRRSEETAGDSGSGQVAAP